jgi:hypothetical protein
MHAGFDRIHTLGRKPYEPKMMSVTTWLPIALSDLAGLGSFEQHGWCGVAGLRLGTDHRGDRVSLKGWPMPIENQSTARADCHMDSSQIMNKLRTDQNENNRVVG